MKKYLLLLLFAGLLVAHQDYWQWHRSDLLWDWLPFSLFYHALVSIAAATFWLVVVNAAWPTDVKQVQPNSETNDDKGAAP